MYTIEVKKMATVSEELVFGEMEPFKSFTSNTQTLSTVDANVINGSFITVTFGGDGTASAWNKSEQGIRAYARNTVEVKSESTIIEIVLTYTKVANKNGYVPEIVLNSFVEDESATGTVTGTWTGSSKNVTFTLSGSAGNFSITSIKVTYAEPTQDLLAQAALDALPELASRYTEDFTVDAVGKFDLPIKWSSNNDAIKFSETAEDGVYTATVTRGSEDATVTVTATITYGDVEKVRTYNMITVPAASATPEPAEKSWQLVTSLDKLNDDVEIIITTSTKDYAMGGITGTNTYASNIAIKATDGMTDIPSGVVIYTIKKGADGKFAIMSDGKYFRATAAKKVTLDDTAGYWTISIDAKGVATITSETTSYGSLKYNTSSPRFTTYTSGQATLSIYALV